MRRAGSSSPSTLREQLGFAPGTELEVEAVDGHLEVVVPSRVRDRVRAARRPLRRRWRCVGDRLDAERCASSDRTGPTLTADTSAVVAALSAWHEQPRRRGGGARRCRRASGTRQSSSPSSVLTRLPAGLAVPADVSGRRSCRRASTVAALRLESRAISCCARSRRPACSAERRTTGSSRLAGRRARRDAADARPPSRGDVPPSGRRVRGHRRLNAGLMPAPVPTEPDPDGAASASAPPRIDADDRPRTGAARRAPRAPGADRRRGRADERRAVRRARTTSRRSASSTSTASRRRRTSSRSPTPCAPDVVEPSLPREVALASAPAVADGGFLVPSPQADEVDE